MKKVKNNLLKRISSSIIAGAVLFCNTGCPKQNLDNLIDRTYFADIENNETKNKKQNIIEIDSIEELQMIGNDSAYPLDGNYILTQNIDASDTANWDNGKGFNKLFFNNFLKPPSFSCIMSHSNNLNFINLCIRSS